MRTKFFGISVIAIFTSLVFPQNDSVKIPGLSVISFVVRCDKDSVIVFTGCENRSDKEYWVWPVEFNFWSIGFNRETFDHRDVMDKFKMWGTTDDPILKVADLIQLPSKGIFGRQIAFPKNVFNKDDFKNKYLIKIGLTLHIKPNKEDSAQEVNVSGELRGTNIPSCLENISKKEVPKKGALKK